MDKHHISREPERLLPALASYYRAPTLCLLLAIVTLLVSLWAGHAYGSTWFGRGASIAVFMGAAAEYCLGQIEQRCVNEEISGTGGLSGPVIITLDMGPLFSKLRFLTHFTIGIATLAWGFGDLLPIGPAASQNC